MMLEFKEFYWMHRMTFIASGVTAASLLLVQIALVFWTTWRLREVAHMRERLSRLADGLALLTDTTEAGFAAVMRELEQPVKRSAPRAPRAVVNKRVASAAKKGTDIGLIAKQEALSESEVRLHLKLAEAKLRERLSA